MNINRRKSWMWAEACALLDEAEHRHRHFFDLVEAPSAGPVWEPPVDIVTDGIELRIMVALPGARAEDVAVQITPSGLSIETNVPPPSLETRMNVVRLEIPYGRMRRRIALSPGRYSLVENRLDRGYLFLRLARETP